MTRHDRSRKFAALPIALALGAGTLMAGCGDDDDSSSTATTAEVTTSADAVVTTTLVSDELTVTGVWARTSPATATAGAVYMEIANPSEVDDALVDVSVDASLAGTAELHETSMATDDTGSTTGGDTGSTMGGDTGSTMGGATETTMDGGGMMTMKEVEEIPVPAGGSAVLEPGGYHVMLLDLVEPLVAGETIEVTLTFEVVGEMVVEAEVRDAAP